MMDLGAAVFAASYFAPKMGPEVSQPQLGILGQPGTANLADPADWLGAPLERRPTLDHRGRNAA